MTHELKTWPLFYGALLSGVKTFEVRKNDRDFQNGDTLLLREWSSTEGYSGRQMLRQVSYMFMNSPWLLPGYVVMGLASTKHSEACSIHAFPNIPSACDCLQAEQPAEARTERDDRKLVSSVALSLARAEGIQEGHAAGFAEFVQQFGGIIDVFNELPNDIAADTERLGALIASLGKLLQPKEGGR